MDDLESSGAGLEVVEHILTAMETNPKADYGAPGPLVHFVERFYGQGYEAALLSSVGRQPTHHTLWMLNRLVNGTKEPGERDSLIGALKAAAEDPRLDDDTRESAQHYVELHT